MMSMDTISGAPNGSALRQILCMKTKSPSCEHADVFHVVAGLASTGRNSMNGISAGGHEGVVLDVSAVRQLTHRSTVAVQDSAEERADDFGRFGLMRVSAIAPVASDGGVTAAAVRVFSLDWFLFQGEGIGVVRRRHRPARCRAAFP
jgi:hypothetical protein